MSRKRSGTMIRTRLSPAEWQRVRKIAAKRSLDGSQLVTQIVREQLLAPAKETN